MFGRKAPEAEKSAPGWPQTDHDAAFSDNEKDIDPDSGVKRGLKNRHLSMMALAGIIGPGLLVGSGGAISTSLQR